MLDLANDRGVASQAAQLQPWAGLLSALLVVLAGPALGRAQEPATQPATQPTTQTWARLARPDPSWVAVRVGEARQRLAASPGGERIWAAIEAHGGLERWYLNGPLSLRYTYAPIADRPVRDTRQIIDTWSSRARHRQASDPEVEFGWDGHEAWVKVPEGADPPATNVRFWSLTPYYFVATPFVLADPGVNLELEGEAEWNGRTYDLVRAAFAPGTGDAPDDYYVVYVDQETDRVGALRYVVSYPGFFPDGGHSPEKLMTYEDYSEVDGILLAQRSRFYAWDGSQTGELVTEVTVQELAFEPDAPSAMFEVPDGATVLEGY